MLVQQEHDQLNITDTAIKTNSVINNQPQGFPNRIRHIYLQQENIYGRFVPFLLLKDKLHSQIDSSGTSALIHMCSHNSPYLPLYLSTLKDGDPILNRPTNQGHTPIDVAAMYCRRQYLELLKAKGAIDQGRADCWAIQGGNISNWSGQVDPSKKVLIHWAAYNNLVDVMKKYVQIGADVNQVDTNGNTPIDIAVMNKSYQTLQLLAKIGYKPKKNLIQQSGSHYIISLFKELQRDQASLKKQKILKNSLIPLFLLFSALLSKSNYMISLLVLALYSVLVLTPVKADSQQRPTKFYSYLVGKEINYNSNHLTYVSMMLTLVLAGLDTLFNLNVASYLLALYFWIMIGTTFTFFINLCVLLYGICTNTTPSQMYNSHKHLYLWKKIDYITARNILTRVYKNPFRKTVVENITTYLQNRGN